MTKDLKEDSSYKDLTEREQLFIKYLSGSAKGDPYKAKELAGYSEHYSLTSLMKRVSPYVTKEAASYLEINALKAAMKLSELVDSPTKLGANNLISAANSILDRAGIVKKDKLEVEHTVSTALLVLPEKKKPTIDISPSQLEQENSNY